MAILYVLTRYMENLGKNRTGIIVLIALKLLWQAFWGTHAYQCIEQFSHFELPLTSGKWCFNRSVTHPAIERQSNMSDGWRNGEKPVFDVTASVYKASYRFIPSALRGARNCESHNRWPVHLPALTVGKFSTFIEGPHYSILLLLITVASTRYFRKEGRYQRFSLPSSPEQSCDVLLSLSNFCLSSNRLFSYCHWSQSNCLLHTKNGSYLLKVVLFMYLSRGHPARFAWLEPTYISSTTKFDCTKLCNNAAESILHSKFWHGLECKKSFLYHWELVVFVCFSMRSTLSSCCRSLYLYIWILFASWSRVEEVQKSGLAYCCVWRGLFFRPLSVVVEWYPFNISWVSRYILLYTLCISSCLRTNFTLLAWVALKSISMILQSFADLYFELLEAELASRSLLIFPVETV